MELTTPVCRERQDTDTARRTTFCEFIGSRVLAVRSRRRSKYATEHFQRGL